MPVDHLVANFKAYIDALCKGRAKNLGMVLIVCVMDKIVCVRACASVHGCVCVHCYSVFCLARSSFFFKFTNILYIKTFHMLERRYLGSLSLLSTDSLQSYLCHVFFSDPLVTEIYVVAPPSTERFLLPVEDYVPGYEQTDGKQDQESDSEDEAEEAGGRK